MSRWLTYASNLRHNWLLLPLVPALTSCGGRLELDGSATASSPITQATFTLTAPAGVSPLAPALESANSLVIGAGAMVMPSAPVVAMGSSGTTRVEPDAQLNDLWSRGSTTLADRVKILGWVHTTALTLGNSVSLDQTKKDLTPVFDPVSTLSWTVTFPATTPTEVNLDPPKKTSVDPGYYSNVRLGGDGAELTFRTGTYYIDALTLESQTKVWLDQTAGPVIIYASNIWAFRGKFAAVNGASPDLLVGYLGTNPITVETNFNGALIAPNANITIRSVTGGHTGFFAGKNVELDAHAIVNYRVPNVVVDAADPPEADCRSLVALRLDLTGDAQEEAYAADLARYCGLCISRLDSDKDKTPDCLDGCPYDPEKTAPGTSGCGFTDVPDDGDNVPPGVDQCNADGRNISAGDCGCVGESNLAPTGTPCGDPPCPGQLAPVCDGAGKCGDAAACLPATDCAQVSTNGDNYFFCGSGVPGTPTTPRTWADVGAVCRAKGLVPARVDTYAQDQLIRKLLKSFNISKAWLGGNQVSVADAWRWATATSNNGDQFWSGGLSGLPVDGRFSFWASANPNTAKCLAIQSTDGRWVGVDCSQALPYVCQNPQVPRTWDPPPPAIPAQPWPSLGSSSPCISEFSGDAPLPKTLEDLKAQYDAAHADPHKYTGAAANPPGGSSTCPVSTLADNCSLTNIKSPTHAGCDADCDCISTDECTEQFGSNYVCLPVRDDDKCVPDGDADITCSARARCGVPNCPVDTSTSSCSVISICPTDEPEYTAGEDPESDLEPITVKPDDFFPLDQKPDTTPSPTYSDPPKGSGTNHSWCTLNPQATGKIKDAKQDGLNKQGQSGKGSKLLFKFKPDLIFDANPNPLAFGESDFGLHAAASLTAHAALNNFLGLSWEKDVLKASVGIKATRCSVSTQETSFQILGKDFTDLVKFVPSVNTDDFTGVDLEAVNGCDVGVTKFLQSADRLKKAFRDAQQLLAQYKAVKAGGQKFNPNFCADLGIEELANEAFPGAGICPGNESPEETINRFIAFYQGDEVGEFARLGSATTALNVASGLIRDRIASAIGGTIGSPQIHAPFTDFKRSESKTILKAPFFIGPVPMTIDIAVVASYGLKGSFDLDLSLPTSLGGSRGDSSASGSPVVEQLASAKVGVEPWASAGLTLFVGCDVGIASVGIEGAVTLARISAPINAGVGLALASAPDERPIPEDIQSVAVMSGSKPKYLLPPTGYQFYLTYDVGASVVLSDILSGEVNGKLKIDFWLFSRTWRKRIVKFNGWNPDTFTLVSVHGNTALVAIPGGSNVLTASANSAMGLSEAQLPFTFLALLTPPAPYDPTLVSNGTGGDGGTAGASSTMTTATVDKSKVEGFFYDSLCCLPEGTTCSETERVGCCEPLVCNEGTCQPKPGPACAAEKSPCGFDVDLGVVISCCDGAQCPLSGVCPVACIGGMESCTAGGTPCCGGVICGRTLPGLCEPSTQDPPCVFVNSDCSPGAGFCCSAENQGLSGTISCQVRADKSERCTLIAK